MKSFISTAAVLILFSGFTTSLIAQPNMQQQYQALYTKSSTWEDYKVIKLNALNAFWTVVTDTLTEKQQAINTANSEIAMLKGQMSEIKSQLASTEIALQESQSLNNSIGFIGLQMSKTAYNIFVWLIIFSLAAGIGTVFMMFQRSNVVTIQTRKTFKDLEREFNVHKERAREMQIRLKRELQTALNKLSEQRV